MNPILQKQPAYDVAIGQVTRNKVLRNTFWLLALSMIPTVLGAFVGITMNVALPGGFIGMAIFLAIAFGFMYAIEKTKESAAGVVRPARLYLLHGPDAHARCCATRSATRTAAR